MSKKEIQQPLLEKPDFKDPFTWASVNRTYTEWLRHVAPQVGLDVNKLILGKVLISIVGDDSNTFFWTMKGTYFDSETASLCQKHLLERLDWEIGTEELPEYIRGRLEEIKGPISELDWSNKRDFETASSIWFPVRDWVEEEIDKTPELKEAEDYSWAMTKQLTGHWCMFLYGKTLFED